MTDFVNQVEDDEARNTLRDPAQGGDEGLHQELARDLLRAVFQYVSLLYGLHLSSDILCRNVQEFSSIYSVVVCIAIYYRRMTNL